MFYPSHLLFQFETDNANKLTQQKKCLTAPAVRNQTFCSLKGYNICAIQLFNYFKQILEHETSYFCLSFSVVFSCNIHCGFHENLYIFLFKIFILKD